MITVHTSRTIMTNEMIEVLNCPMDEGDYFDIMEGNVFNKRTDSSRRRTIRYLKQLYGFQKEDIRFQVLEDYWTRIIDEEKPLVLLLYSICQDFLLRESVSFVQSVSLHEKATIDGFERNILNYHPKRFSQITLHSIAKNIASSWKQAGYIEGKVKNLRVKRSPSYLMVSFALLMAYIDGARGEYMMDHPAVKALDVSKNELHQLIKAAADRDLVRYNKSGETMVISFENYLNRLGHGES